MYQGIYRVGTVAQAMERECARVLREGPKLALPSDRAMCTRSAHMEYRGKEIPRFSAYMRWAVSGDRAVISSISAPSERRGRMPVIMAALETLFPTVDVENVVNPHLQAWLHRRGYRPIHNGQGPAPWPSTFRMIRGVSGVDFYTPWVHPKTDPSAPGAR